jgi:hypothetical protein
MLILSQYWDSITREDLEFSVGTKQNNWEVKELLPEDDRRNTLYQDTKYQDTDYPSTTLYNSTAAPGRNSNYEGFTY